MSTSSISLLSAATQTQTLTRAQQIQQDFKQLADSLQSGDLSGAQKAYTALQKLLPSQSQNSTSSTQSSSQSSSSSTNPISNDFNALGKALQSGDLTAAQSAFSTLQSDLKAQTQSSTTGALMQAMRPHHHHHAAATQDSDGDSNSSSSSTSTASSSSTSSSASSTSTTGQIVNILA
jgi:outer membrane protein assembly factor BamD (BamD/ComL family)